MRRKNFQIEKADSSRFGGAVCESMTIGSDAKLGICRATVVEHRNSAGLFSNANLKSVHRGVLSV